MKRSNGIPLILLFVLLLLFNGHRTVGQNTRMDSLLMTRQNLVNVYDSLRTSGISDSGQVNTNALLKAANDIFNYDNHLLDTDIKGIANNSDSLMRVQRLYESSFESQAGKIRELNTILLGISAAALVCLVLFFIMLAGWYRRKSLVKRLALQHLETERILAEYRKRLNELQSDLDNCRTQAKNLVNENSRLEKEISSLADDIQKARDAGWLAESAGVSFPDQIRILEEQLEAEATRKKILEQELLEILRRLRGEE